MTESPVPEPRAPGLVASAAFALGVFAGAVALGLVVLPALSLAVGVFDARADAEAFFAWATLKSVPTMVGASILTLLVQPWILARGRPARIGLILLCPVVVWCAAAATSAMRLG